MAFRIVTDESVASEVRRIAREQLDRAIETIDNDDVSIDVTVHETRKRLKRIRGLVRLVRPEFSRYSQENASLRDTAGRMSEIRDAGALLETCDALTERFGDTLNRDPIGAVRAALSTRRDDLLDSIGARGVVRDVRAELDDARDRVSDWRLNAKGFDAIAGGLEKVYRRARKRMTDVLSEPSTENLHEWRKRAKYHRYHLRLLREAWPGVMGARRDSAKLLTDRLGDDHDLAVLRAELTANPDRYDARAASVVLGLIDHRRSELQAWAKPTGTRLFSETPKRAVARIREAWDAWVVERQLEAALPSESILVS